MDNIKRKGEIASFLRDPKTGQRLLDKQEVLQKFHLSERSLQRWRTDRRITYIKIKNKTYYPENEVNELLEEHRVPKKQNNEA